MAEQTSFFELLVDNTCVRKHLVYCDCYEPIFATEVFLFSFLRGVLGALYCDIYRSNIFAGRMPGEKLFCKKYKFCLLGACAAWRCIELLLRGFVLSIFYFWRLILFCVFFSTGVQRNLPNKICLIFSTYCEVVK